MNKIRWDEFAISIGAEKTNEKDFCSGYTMVFVRDNTVRGKDRGYWLVPNENIDQAISFRFDIEGPYEYGYQDVELI